MWKTSVWGLLLHPTEAKVWLSVETQSYRLPSIMLNDPEGALLPHEKDGALPLVVGLQEAYGCHLHLLQTVDQWEDAESRQTDIVCLLEIKDGQPSGGEWADMQAASTRPFAVPAHRKWVQQALEKLAEERATPPEFTWQYRGWFAQAIGWIERQLARLGYGPVLSTEQLRTSNTSLMLRVHTDGSVFYFKTAADAPWLANEPAVANTLGTYYPHLVPKPVCIDATRRWMLTAEFGPTLEDPERDQEMLVQVARTYGQMQLNSAAHLADLIDTDPWGCDLARLPSTWEAYLRKSKVMEMLQPEEVTALQRHVPLVQEYSRQLAESPIPQTIVHGDLGPYNIAQFNDKPLIFDWTDVGISFPFFDIVELLHRVRPPSAGGNASVRTPAVDEIKERIRLTYLSTWTDYAPLSELEKLWRLCQPLGFVSMALHLPFPYFPRRVLQFLESP
ncbi:MAG: phosphotransferase [Candidatus Latescibacteria bacterium]|nr:phosphotransferase [Candidatus Latescibacterota bacterium]